jgi:hypothetical protein
MLVGEIVDTKCYLGAMNPGRGGTHLSFADPATDRRPGS